jgi:hypothetical protein
VTGMVLLFFFFFFSVKKKRNFQIRFTDVYYARFSVFPVWRRLKSEIESKKCKQEVFSEVQKHTHTVEV